MVALSGICLGELVDIVQAVEKINGSGPMVPQDSGGISAGDVSGVVHDRPISQNEEKSHAEGRESAVVKERDDTYWRRPLVEYLHAPDNTTSQKIRRQALK
jgi:hypothetical protein